MKVALILLLQLVAYTVALPAGLKKEGTNDELRLLEDPQVDKHRTKRHFGYPGATIIELASLDLPYQSSSQNLAKSVETGRSLSNDIESSPSINGHQIRFPGSEILNDQASGSLAEAHQNADISSFQVAQVQPVENGKPGPRNLIFPLVNLQSGTTGRQLIDNAQTVLSEPLESVTLLNVNSIPSYVSPDLQARVIPLVETISQPSLNSANPYSRTSQEHTAVKSAPVYYSSDPNANNILLPNLNIRQIIPSPQEVLNSALNIGNRIIEVIPGYHLTANVVGLLGNITRTGATIINNQIQSQLNPVPYRPYPQHPFPLRPISAPALVLPPPVPALPAPVPVLPAPVPYPTAATYQPATPSKISLTSTTEAAEPLDNNENEQIDTPVVDKEPENEEPALDQNEKQESQENQDQVAPQDETRASDEEQSNEPNRESSSSSQENDALGDFNNPVAPEETDESLAADEDTIDAKSAKSTSQ